MKILNYIIDNDYVIYGLIATTVGFIGYKFISSYAISTPIQTPNSPPTFNLTLDQLKEIEIQSEQETHKLSLNQLKELKDRLDNEEELDDILKNILTEEQFKLYQAELLDPKNDFSDNLQDIFDNLNISGLDYSTILELIDIITNLISHFYFWF
jgi:hypothetical protein